jgi:TolA-binding protein
VVGPIKYSWFRRPSRRLFRGVGQGAEDGESKLVAQADGHRRLLDLIVEPLSGGPFRGGVRRASGDGSRPQCTRPPEPSSDGLERELATTREQLRATIDALESANEEMESSNEEYQLQSTNEELETSKEEMQSINEELQTVNAELSSKNDQLTRTVSDPIDPAPPAQPPTATSCPGAFRTPALSARR